MLCKLVFVLFLKTKHHIRNHLLVNKNPLSSETEAKKSDLSTNNVIEVPGLNPVITCVVEKSTHWVKVNIDTPDSDHSVSFHYS